jgi:hypothetical protein
LGRCCELVGSAFREIDQANENALDALLGMVEWYDRSIVEDPAYLQLRMRAESETNDDDVREGLASTYRELVGLVAALVQRGQKQGMFKPEISPEAAAWMFMAMGQVGDLTHMLGMEGVEARKCFRELGELFWGTLVVPSEMPRVKAIAEGWAEQGRK